MAGNVPFPRRARVGLAPFMVLPCVVLLAVFAYRPVLASVELSLFGSDILGRPARFVALDHYTALFTEPDLRRMVLVTLVIAALSTALAIGAGLAAALPLRRAASRGAGVVSVVLSLPFAYSAAAASAVFAGLFAPAVGTLNQALAGFGIAGPAWLHLGARVHVAASAYLVLPVGGTSDPCRQPFHPSADWSATPRSS